MTKVAGQKQDKPKKVLHKSHGITLSIYPSYARGQLLWTLVYYSVNKERERETFSNLARAKERANEVAEMLVTQKVPLLQLTAADAEAYNQAIAMLRSLPGGITLTHAIHEYVTAKLIAGSESLIDASKEFAGRRSRPEISVSDLVEGFLQVKAKRSPDYLQGLRYRLRDFAAQFQCNLSHITFFDLEHYLTQKNLAPRSWNNFRNTLITIYRHAQARGLVESGSVLPTKLERHRVTSPIQLYTPEELYYLLSGAPEHVRPFVALAAYAGLRSQEIARLRWEDVKWEQGVIAVSVSAAKTAQRRLVPILPALRRWLKPLNTDRIYPYTSKQKGYYLIVDGANRLATKDGKVIEWKRNAFRHSFISYRVADIKNVNQVALECGTSAKVIHSNYLELVTHAESKKWFGIKPLTNI